MPMEITSNNNNINTYSPQESSFEMMEKATMKSAEKTEAASAQKTSSTCQQTTSTRQKTQDYYKSLTSRFGCLTPTKDTAVTINSGLLARAAADPEKAAWLEKTLSDIPGCIDKIAENIGRRGGKLQFLSISIDSEDCMTTHCLSTSDADPGTEEAKKHLEEAIERNKERKKEWEDSLQRHKEKKAEVEEQLENAREWRITTDSVETLMNHVEGDSLWERDKKTNLAFDRKA